MYEAKVDHFSNFLHRRVKQGEVVPIPGDEFERNRELYGEIVAQEEANLIPREELEKKAITKKLCHKTEVGTLSYDQLLALVKKG